MCFDVKLTYIMTHMIHKLTTTQIHGYTLAITLCSLKTMCMQVHSI